MSKKTIDNLLDKDYDLLSFQDKCKFVNYSHIGAIWYNKKSGIAAKLVGQSWRGVHLKRNNGKITVIQDHYFAYNYRPCV